MESHGSGDHGGHHQEHEHGHDATAASENWKNKAQGRGYSGLGRVVRTVLGEGFWHLGARSLSAVPKVKGVINAEVAADPLASWAAEHIPSFASGIVDATTAVQLGYTATGLGSLALGAGIAASRLKDASWLEKSIFWGSKAAVAAAHLFNPAWLPVTTAISAGSTWLALRNRHAHATS